MPTKRTPIRRNLKVRLTPQIVAVWVRLRELAADPVAREEWEPVGRHREYLETKLDLDRLLGHRPWCVSPLEADGPEPRDYMRHNPILLESWRKAWEWRQVLEEATQ